MIPRLTHSFPFQLSNDRAIIRGCGDIWIVLRPGESIQGTPLGTLYIPDSLVPDVMMISGIDKSNNIYVRDWRVQRINLDTLSTNRYEFDCVGCEGETAVNAAGYFLAISDYHWQFSLFNPRGDLVVDGYKLRDNERNFQKPDTVEPFWEIGANSICANDTAFAVTGWPLEDRIDLYTLSGEVINIIKDFKYNGTLYSLEKLGPRKIQFDFKNRIWVTCWSSLIVFKFTGECIFFEEISNLEIIGQPAYARMWFAIDKRDLFWTLSKDYIGAFEVNIE